MKNCLSACAVLAAGAGAAAGPVTLTHSLSQEVVLHNSVACNVQTPMPQTTVVNHYWRTFDLAAFNITGALTVTSVEIGVEEAVGPNGSGRQTIEVRLYNDTDGGTLNLGDLVPVGETTRVVTDRTLSSIAVAVGGEVPAGGTLVVEVMSRDLRGDPPQQTGGRFYIGSNRAGETGPSYFSAPQCAYANPVLPETIAPGVVMHYVMTVQGETTSGCYPDCDPSTGPGVLDIFDFLCFQNLFAAQDPYACDCDTSSGPGVCDIFDFLCFQNEFAAGCP